MSSAVEEVSVMVNEKLEINEAESSSGAGSGSEEETVEKAEAVDSSEELENMVKSEESDQQFYDAPDKIGFEVGRRDSGFVEDKNKKEESAAVEQNEDDEDTSEFQVPDEELIKKIVEQVEFYFSDESITRDAFLLKHVRRNKEGYVSLKLISCFKRVKHLTKDWRQVTYALKKCSTKLQVNDLNTKVRRIDPLPPCDETTPSRSVIAYNLPMDKPNVENIAELFNKYGDIALIRILRPSNAIPGDIKQFLAKHPEIGNSVCALVEFEKTEYAKIAVDKSAAAESDNENWRADGLKVLQLTLKPKKEKTKLKKSVSNDEGGRRLSTESQLSGSEREELELLRRRNQRRRGSRVEILRGDAPAWIDTSGTSGTDSECSSPMSIGGYQRRYSYGFSSPSSAGSSVSCCSSASGHQHRDSCCYRRNPFDFATNPTVVGHMISSPPAHYYHPHAFSRGGYGSEADRTSWRRPSQPLYVAPQIMVSTHTALSRRHSDATTGLTVPENVLRLPKGPDGSKGFNPNFRPQSQWTQPNRFQQKGRSGSVPAVVFTQYVQPQQNGLENVQQEFYDYNNYQQQVPVAADQSVHHEQTEAAPTEPAAVEIVVETTAENAESAEISANVVPQQNGNVGEVSETVAVKAAEPITSVENTE